MSHTSLRAHQSFIRIPTTSIQIQALARICSGISVSGQLGLSVGSRQAFSWSTFWSSLQESFTAHQLMDDQALLERVPRACERTYFQGWSHPRSATQVSRRGRRYNSRSGWHKHFPLRDSLDPGVSPIPGLQQLSCHICGFARWIWRWRSEGHRDQPETQTIGSYWTPNSKISRKVTLCPWRGPVGKYSR